MKKQKVIIIGAGPAGLTAGYELLKKDKNYQVTILEETNEIGGISKTVNYKGNRMDIGGHRFFSKNQEVMDFWKEILPLQGKPSYDDQKLNRQSKVVDHGPDPEKENKVMLIRKRISRIFCFQHFFDYPIRFQKETFQNLGLQKTLLIGFSYLKSCIYKRKENNLENFYINRFGKKLYQMFFEKYTEKLWGRHPSNFSADWGIQRVKGLSIRSVVLDMCQKTFHWQKQKVETSLIEEFWYPKYGPGQLWEEVAKKFEKMGGVIERNQKVIKIKQKNHKILSVTCFQNGKEIEVKGDIFLSSMPLKDLIQGMNQVPSQIKEIALGLPYRDFITMGLLVKKLNLKNETKIPTLGNIIPDCWIYVQDEEVKVGRIQIFNNWSPYLVKKKEDTVWIGVEYFCQEQDELWKMSEKDFADFAISELEKIGILQKEDVLDFHQEKVKKAYPAYFDTYGKIEQVRNYINQFANLYCIGRNGQHRYNNMDHSMMTSFEAVACILNPGKEKNSIWQVNTEKEYGEEKYENNNNENQKLSSF